jgi:hypothetical protein
LNAASLEVYDVAGGRRCAARSGNGGDLRIELSHWLACLTAFGRELGIGMCSGLVEGKHTPGEVLFEHPGDGLSKPNIAGSSMQSTPFSMP